ncbi:MAG: maleylpyruvate isomerase N-terminal domain-containing protein [Acidimicrobiales bacterium]
MPSDAELAGLDPVDLMDQEAARIEAHLAGLSAGELLRQSRCDGWTVRDVLAHLAATERYHHACLDGQVQALIEELVGRGATDLDAFNALGIADVSTIPDDELLRQWSRDDAETRRRFRERGDGEVDSSVGPYSARWQAFHLAGELAIHADDIFVPVPETDRAARLDWRVRFSRFSLEESKPELTTEAAGGRTRVVGGGQEVELDDELFVEAVAGRAAEASLEADVQALLSTMP